jgi:hypothetical protein
MMGPIPTVGRIVHYVSYGSAGGEFPSACRAAVVTEVHDPDTVSLAVLNPTGLFFDLGLPYADPVDVLPGGTWHWPERAPEPPLPPRHARDTDIVNLPEEPPAGRPVDGVR